MGFANTIDETMSDLRKIIIDGIETEALGDMTLIQVCEQMGIEIPRFCYHERLSIAGNCRMCLVEIVGGPPKPAASCAMQVKDLRPGPEGAPPEIRTRSDMARQAREGVMEFLLINHPLDCPICDQGGECDLQDQAVAYGMDFSRYREAKRAIDDLDLGPLVETHMTRCISCTRCVRFTTEVAGITQMGQSGRGEDAEIISYLNQTLHSNMQGNIIDLCPVGALTSKPYAFTARSWELEKVESIDVMDALGSNIRVDSKGRRVMRILPRNHDGVNEEWISDKTRFVWDGLTNQRLDRPFIRVDGKLVACSWDQALDEAGSLLKSEQVTSIAGDLVSVEAVYALGQLTDSLKGKKECRVNNIDLPIGNRSGYVGTSRIEDIDSAGRILMIGTNPGVEAPVLNARIRASWLAGSHVELVGEAVDLTYEYKHHGTDLLSLQKLAKNLADVELTDTLIILGQGALHESLVNSALGIAMNLAARGAGLLILHTAAGRVGAMDLGFATEGGMGQALDGAGVIYNLGVDEIDIPSGPKVIYQGSHGDRGAHRADIILPAAAYTEEAGIFVNTEGRPQLASKATFPVGEAKENWAIIRALSGKLGMPLEYNSQIQLRLKLAEEFPHLMEIDMVQENELQPIETVQAGNAEFKNVINDFYLTNPIARASAVMAELSYLTRTRDGEFNEAA